MKNLQHNIDKPNPSAHKKGCTLRSTSIYARNESWVNIWKLINVIHYINKKHDKKNYMIASVGTEKAFDKIKISSW